jgi:hypothetical protein
MTGAAVTRAFVNTDNAKTRQRSAASDCRAIVVIETHFSNVSNFYNRSAIVATVGQFCQSNRAQQKKVTIAGHKQHVLK